MLHYILKCNVLTLTSSKIKLAKMGLYKQPWPNNYSSNSTCLSLCLPDQDGRWVKTYIFNCRRNIPTFMLRLESSSVTWKKNRYYLTNMSFLKKSYSAHLYKDAAFDFCGEYLTLSTLISWGDPHRSKLCRKLLTLSSLPPSFCPKSSSREFRSIGKSSSSSTEPLHTLLRPSTRSLGIRSQLSLRSLFLRPESTRVRPLAGAGGGGGGIWGGGGGIWGGGMGTAAMTITSCFWVPEWSRYVP